VLADVRPPFLLLAALYVLVCFTWGTTWLGIKLAVDTVPPLTAAGLRFLIAFPPLLAYALLRGEPLRFPRGQGGYFAAMTGGYFFLPYFLINFGGQYVSSGLAALLFSTMPVFVVIFSAFMLRERVHWSQLLGIGLGFYALTMVVTGEGLALAYGQKLGALAILLAAVLHAACYVAAKSHGAGVSPVTFNTLPAGIAGALLFAAGLAFERPDLADISATSLLALVYLGAVASVGGFIAYFHLLKHLSPVTLSFVFLIFPVVSVALAHVVEGTRFSPDFPFFAGMLLAGFALTMLAKLPSGWLRARDG